MSWGKKHSATEPNRFILGLSYYIWGVACQVGETNILINVYLQSSGRIYLMSHGGRLLALNIEHRGITAHIHTHAYMYITPHTSVYDAKQHILKTVCDGAGSNAYL